MRNRIEMAPQALLIAAGVIVSVAIISIMMVELDVAKGMARTVEENVIRATQKVANSDVMQYDGVRVSGAEVRNFFKLHMTKKGADGFETLTIDNAFSKYTHTDSSMYSKMTDERDYMYINPADMYLCTVNQNDNGIITEVIFEINK